MKKELGQVFTPSYIVEKMLDMLDYTGENILNKKILEPSFGDGAFMLAIVQRILNYATWKNFNNEEIINILDNIYGVELDKKYYDITIDKLNSLLKKYKIHYDWKNLKNENTLTYKPDVDFDLIVANPPYIKIKTLNEFTRNIINKNYKFGEGNTDLYVIFFELCINMMKKDGKMCFITPNSYFRNTSQKEFRKYLTKHNLISTIIDYGNIPVFENFGTYTAITFFDFNKSSNLTTYTLMKSEKNPEYTTSINLSDFKNNYWNFSSPSDAAFLKKIEKRSIKLKDLCEIQHGITTNADSTYVINKDNLSDFEEEILRPVVKGSTLKTGNKIIFPYLWNEKLNKYIPFSEEELKKYPKTYQYLLDHKEILNSRNMEKNLQWFQYARSQGINNTNNKKIALKHILSDKEETCDFKELDEKTLVYSGIYIIVKDGYYEKVKEVLSSKEFHQYLMLVGKNMAGGYRHVSAKLVKEFGILTDKQDN